MIIIGLTGSIGMGKSTVAGLLRDFGFPVYSADKAVHRVMKKGGSAFKLIKRHFPEVLKRGAIDRPALGRAVFGKPRKLRKLEELIHPCLRTMERQFLQKARKTKARAVILEIPLLFETDAEKRCDIVLCVTAPRAIQCKRVLSRKGMDEKKMRAILARQMPDLKKRQKADYVIPTGVSLNATKDHLRKLLKRLGLLA